MPPPSIDDRIAGASCGARPPRRSAGSIASMPPACPAPARDLPPLEPIAAWRTERNPRRQAAQSWGACCASTTTGCRRAATTCSRPIPAEPDLEMRFLGGEAALAGLVKPLPTAWRIFAARSRRRQALPRPARPLCPPPGRAATPVPARRPPGHGRRPGRDARPRVPAVLGPGPAYREPDQVAETARYLQAEPRFYDRYVAEQDAALAERFGPQTPARSAGRACPPAATGTPAGDRRQAAPDRLLPDQRRGPGPCHPAARDRAPAPARLRADLLHPLPRAGGDRACRLPDRIRPRAGP